MSRYFANKKEFDSWMSNFQKSYREKQGKDLFDQLSAPELTADDYINGLTSDGYTDLDNLVEDGHAYQLGFHTNNGWVFQDELDYFSKHTMPEERIRDKK